MFSRMMSAPVRMRDSMRSGDSVAGPRVHRILVLRVWGMGRRLGIGMKRKLGIAFEGGRDKMRAHWPVEMNLMTVNFFLINEEGEPLS